MKMHKVLFFLARPEDSKFINIEKEAKDIENKVRYSKHRCFEFKHVLQTESKDIIDSILWHSPSIVHFSGHGSDVGKFVLETEDHQREEFSTKRFAKVFRVPEIQKMVKLVVLNACNMEKAVEDIGQYIDFVVGTNAPILDTTARKFASEFYYKLASDLFIPSAFDLTIQQLENEKIEGTDVLYLSKRNGSDESFTFVEDESIQRFGNLENPSLKVLLFKFDTPKNNKTDLDWEILEKFKEREDLLKSIQLIYHPKMTPINKEDAQLQGKNSTLIWSSGVLLAKYLNM